METNVPLEDVLVQMHREAEAKMECIVPGFHWGKSLGKERKVGYWHSIHMQVWHWEQRERDLPAEVPKAHCSPRKGQQEIWRPNCLTDTQVPKNLCCAVTDGERSLGEEAGGSQGIVGIVTSVQWISESSSWTLTHWHSLELLSLGDCSCGHCRTAQLGSTCWDEKRGLENM